jgi:DnaK suppressor protein
MALIWIDEHEDRRMDAKKLKETRQRLSTEYEKLIKSINRSRLAAEEIQLENTEDEGDLATISHDRDLLYNLHEGGFARLRFIQDAIKAIDRGQYGECTHCGNDINEKRLDAVPWATMCISCQEAVEMEQTSSRMVPVGQDSEDSQL